MTREASRQARQALRASPVNFSRGRALTVARRSRVLRPAEQAELEQLTAQRAGANLAASARTGTASAPASVPRSKPNLPAWERRGTASYAEQERADFLDSIARAMANPLVHRSTLRELAFFRQFFASAVYEPTVGGWRAG